MINENETGREGVAVITCKTDVVCFGEVNSKQL